jgi:HSP20 family protein
MQEYGDGEWERQMALPAEVDGSTVTASYTDGILELRLPKTQPNNRRKVPISPG